MPDRLQLSRAKGWRMPPNAVKVDRSTRWGNPFRVGDSAQITPQAPVVVCFSQAEAVEAYRALMITPAMASHRADIRAQLAGKDLACWCKLGTPCHADVLLEIANG